MSNFLAVLIAGTKFRDIEAQVKANRLKPGEPLVLVPEPDNKFDQYAVKVLTPEGLFLGYVPRGWSETVAKEIKSDLEVRCTAGTAPLEIIIEFTNVHSRADEPSQ